MEEVCILGTGRPGFKAQLCLLEAVNGPPCASVSLLLNDEIV